MTLSFLIASGFTVLPQIKVMQDFTNQAYFSGGWLEQGITALLAWPIILGGGSFSCLSIQPYNTRSLVVEPQASAWSLSLAAAGLVPKSPKHDGFQIGIIICTAPPNRPFLAENLGMARTFLEN